MLAPPLRRIARRAADQIGHRLAVLGCRGAVNASSRANRTKGSKPISLRRTSRMIGQLTP